MVQFSTKLAASTTATDLSALEQQTAAAFAGGADLVEWRLDFLTEPQRAVELLHNRPGWRGRLIATCRHESECGGMGGWKGSEEERINLLEAIGREYPGYIDLELITYQYSKETCRQIHRVCAGPEDSASAVAENAEGAGALEKNKLILSWHRFQASSWREDEGLRHVFDAFGEMSPYPFAIHKIAWQPTALYQSLYCLGVADRHSPKIADRPVLPRSAASTILICMGEMGLPTRLLAKKVGLHLSFCSTRAGKAAAPGQIDLAQMKTLYRWDKIGPATKLFGVIGNPVSHSMSPVLHNGGFEAVGFDGLYLPLRPDAPEDFYKFLSFCCCWPQGDWRGFSVTIPFKHDLVEFAARFNREQKDMRECSAKLGFEPGRSRAVELEPLSARIGAANTVHIREDGSMRIFNTDYAGALQALLEGMKAEAKDLRGVPVAVLGAGGTARAIVAGLVDAGARVSLFNRTLERAAEIARDFGESTTGGNCTARAWEDRIRPDVGVPACRIVINTTSIGMHRDNDPSAETLSPLPDGFLQHKHVVFDAVYNPVATRLLQEADAAGATVVDGVSMFVNQAALQFEAWTGQSAPRELFRRIVLNKLSR